ncbi:dihydrodipicolinate synthase family protein [Peribacillus cavernae]|uniref:Dihydrodipicolinate synthase family protein n=1 Tax=Peribacillus cavernae TaxID=1674310 RepID=A0A3S1BCA1_9BACI|nr:dihydrodipicolinate synthase family protein [Peribacillus cavernae]MDQ0218183.1 4-hydroxy-tetrahydrodipicolinate synthase [Peribacillus cavernae]RUQ32672.1 dihydrodipicolinate synthase family protein [Peribacillus cavernae]
MSTITKFHGIIPPVSTILHKDGCLDEKGMENLIDFLIDSKVDGLFFLGSGGEFSQMSVELRKEVAEFAIQYVNGRLPVLIGTGSTSTKEAILLSLHAKEAGADGVVIINPYYWVLSDENLFQHYADIAENVKMPILLYNFPALTGQDLSPEFVLKLARVYPNIVGIKETVESVAHTREMILTVKSEINDFAVFSGFDDHLLNTLSLGGDGSIPATANFAPELSTGIYQAFKQGNYGQAIELHRKLAPLPTLYKLDSPFVSVVKEALCQRGIEVSKDVLAPARPLNDEKKAQVKKIINQVLDKSGVSL